MGAITYTALREIENDSAPFVAPLADAGGGVVNTVLQRGTGSPTFTRATSAWTVLSDGTIGLVASGSPRSYYSPAGVYQGYLSEATRTNLCQRGEDFATVWADVGTPTLSAGTTTLGALSLSTLGDDSAAALEGKTQTVTFTGNAVKAIAVYVKQGTSTSSVIRLRDNTAGADRLLAAITWSGTVPVVTMTTGTDLTGTPQQQGATSGVYRLLFATTSVTAANANSLQLYPATTSALAVAGTGTIQIGGVQAEDATFPSSLIRTPASATVTRNADVLTYPFGGNAIATVGSAYAEIALLPQPAPAAAISFVGTGAGLGPLLIAAAGSTTTISNNDGTNTVTKSGLTDLTTGSRKRAASWGTGQSITGDGATVATGSFDGDIGSVAVAIGCTSAGAAQAFGAIKNVRIYQTQVTDAILAQMTSATEYVRALGGSYTLEFYSEKVDRSVKVKRSMQQPIGGGAPEVLTYRRETFVDVTVLGPLGALLTEAQILQWREFLASVEGGETFTFDRYGTVAVPVEAKTAILASEDYTEERITGVGNAGLYKLSCQVRLLT